MKNITDPGRSMIPSWINTKIHIQEISKVKLLKPKGGEILKTTREKKHRNTRTIYEFMADFSSEKWRPMAFGMTFNS